MKRIILTIILITSFISVFSQSYKLEISASPATLLDPTHPCFRAGTEFFIFKKFSIGIDAGYGMTLNYKVSEIVYQIRDMKKYNYFQFRPNIKFLVYSGFDYKYYIGLEYFYMQENDIIKNNNIYSAFNYKTEVSQADYFRNKEGIQLILGIKAYPINKHFFMDMYAGGGIAIKYAQFSNLENPIYENSYPACLSFGKMFHGFTPLMPHITVNIKFGWRFFK